MSVINQKEYLKKYLGIGKAPGEKKKKKKKEKIVGNRLKIIDDDVDVQISQEIVDDLAAANEDAPQIVAVIDERPHSLQIDEKTNSSLWKPIGEPSRFDSDHQSLTLNSFKLGKHSDTKKTLLKIKESVPQTYSKYATHERNSSVTKVKQENYKDKYSRENDTERSSSPFFPLRRKKYDDKDDVSPPRSNDYDNSPPRGSVKDNREIDSDYSPPRKKNKARDSDSPPRKRHDDNSPLRKRKDNSSPTERNRESNNSSRGSYEDDHSPLRRNVEQDSSPPRKKRRDVDSSPPRKIIKEVDSSPPRRKNREDNSPPRRKRDEYSQAKKIRDDDYSPQRKQHKHDRQRREDESSHSPIDIKSEPTDRDISPSRTHKRRNGRKSRWSPERSPDTSSSGEKMKKTLDGKRAGLQNATDLSKESKYLRQKEDEVFSKLSSDVSGRNAATVVRGKKVVKDPEEEAAKAKRAQDMKEKYDRWGKGLKQVEDQNKVIEEQLHEMSKPLARYADDEDLEKFLKEQEREGDPMLAYIRKKKKKEKVAAGIPEKPMYMGEFMPNRFGIRPGYRWDGVDRSNGYEKKWFQVQNEKKASREEAFKWSTEDM